MPRQNRVTPFGEIVATPERGTMMGNRGVLHDHDGRVRRPWQVKRWLVCLLEFHGRHRQVMAPNRYTELFFLDEATALAAGHRPCFECQRRAFKAFTEAWAEGNLEENRPSAASIDERLHQERVGPARSKRTFRASIDDLPDGVFVALSQTPNRPLLLRNGHLLAWTPAGYAESLVRPAGKVATVLTPRSTVATIRAGYAPAVHPSADDPRPA